MPERLRHGSTAPATAPLAPGTDASSGTVPLMLALATTDFLVNFWARALISPLAATYRGELDLTPFQQSFVVAVPVDQ